MLLSHEGELSERLTQLLNYLEKDFYTRLESCCLNAALPLAELKDADTSASLALYTQHCHCLIHQVEQYLRLRRVGLVPYFQELMNMEEEGHDCRNCATPCEIRHSEQIEGIREAHHKIREALIRLRNGEDPQFESTSEYNAFERLNVEINKLRTTLTELFIVEETSLVPLIIQTQKAIHARS